MTELRTTTLGELLQDTGSIKTGPFGTALKASEYSESGVPVISVGEVGYGTLQLRRDTPKVSSNTTSRLPEYVLERGDIVFGRKGAVDRSAFVRPEQKGWFLGSDGIRVRFPDNVNARFIAYQLQSLVTRDWLLRHASGSTMLSLNQNILERVPLVVPSKCDQQAISEVLGALDDKIAVNSKVAAAIPPLMHAIFRSMIKPNCDKVPMGSLATVSKGVSYKSADLAPSSTALVTLKSFKRTGGYIPEGLKDYAGPYKEPQVIDPGELAVAQTDLTQAAEIVGRSVRVPADPSYRTLVASLDVAIVRPANSVPPEFLLGVMTAGPFREHCRANTSGTTVLHLARNAIESFMAPVVSSQKQRRYAEVVRPLLDNIDALDLESRRLAEMRDALLPQLMSGKLQVKDAETMVEGVL